MSMLFLCFFFYNFLKYAIIQSNATIFSNMETEVILMLKRNQYLDIYRSTFNDFDNDFLNPSYAESISFDKGSGYFSLKSLILSIHH